ncbi:hypothetical protein DDK07_10005 [Mycobacteroides abscessus]|nr:hypothetical protein B9M80_06630 [Mycobacteroides abscessus]RWU57211.1 hypothetical protein EPJ93_18410 [Mycobacteroides abscessus subsp. abscessus]PVA13851.1 hypothetical protein DDJ61_16485 [Mycobacteroides abscessus]PVA93586.1 hypothetical protein DDJ76_04965 [Mycobacteroides abscessus]PVB26943.1 hypothetical protein DDJ45_13615 [Mycobacteroides abscessus]
MLSVERQARREAVRKHHPDAGGSAEALIAALQALSGERAPRRAAVRVQPTWRGRLRALTNAARRRRIRRQRTKYLERR